MFNLKFWKKRPPTPEQNIIASFSEEGRWVQKGDSWVDTITKAVLSYASGKGVWINGVHQSFDVSHAFHTMAYKPFREKLDREREAVEALYADN